MSSTVSLKSYFWRRWLALAWLLALMLGSVGPAWAQTPQPSGPVYVVQAGDTLWGISVRFGVSLADLQAANPQINASGLQPGMELVIPGMEGVQGRLETRAIGLGENLLSLSRRYQVQADVLARLNRLTSPTELYVGANLILLESQAHSLEGRALVAPGQSLLEAAVLHNVNPWSLAAWNGLNGPAAALSGDVLHLPAAAEPAEAAPGALPPWVQAIQLAPSALAQGLTALLQTQADAGVVWSGSLAQRPLHFFSPAEGQYAAFQGIHALTEPGLYPLELSASLPGAGEFHFQQYVLVQAGGYAYDPMLYVDPETVNPENTGPEDQLWTGLTAAATPEKLWQGPFVPPVDKAYANCWPSVFGNRRAYNDSAYRYFHTGLDFCGQVGHAIYAPAAGVVVFAGPLTVRGSATMIDHGWGIYSGYMHQSEILVTVGQRVAPGELIGRVGNTGRVTGPHLHWEIWAGGVQVEPADWLAREYP